MKTNPLLIGEAPGPNTDPMYPLSCQIPNSTGDRLRKIMGIDTFDYIRFFDKINLFTYKPEKWSVKEAKHAASWMYPLLYERDTFLLGRRVAQAFGHMDVDFYKKIEYAGCRVWIIPHPSGLNRWYNDKSNAGFSRAFWKKIISERGYLRDKFQATMEVNDVTKTDS